MRTPSGPLAALCLLAAAPAWGQANPQLAGEWSPVIAWPNDAVHVQMLATGKVLFSPDYEDGGTPFLFDPADGSVVPAPPAGFNFFCSGHCQLSTGGVLFVGGHVVDYQGLSTAAVFDPFTLAWSRVADMNGGRWYATATTLASGDALVVSGSVTATSGVNTLPQVLDVGRKAWRDLTAAQVQLPLYPWMFAAPNGKVFYAGPERMGRYLDTSGTGAWSNVAPSSFGYRDYGSAVMYEDGKILLIGGGFPPIATCDAIDLNAAAPAFKPVAPMAGVRRMHNATVLPDGTVLVTGGSRGPTFDDATKPALQAELWDPATNVWRTLASQIRYRGYHSTAWLLPDGRVVSAGSRSQPTAEIFSPPYLFKGPRPTVTAAPDQLAFGQPFTLATPDAAAITQVTLVRLASVTHSFNQNQRLSRLPFTRGAAGLTVTAPASGRVAPPGYYLLFAIGANGVPSLGRIVRLDATPPAPLTVISPNGGEALIAGASAAVRFSAAPSIASVHVELTTDGQTFAPLGDAPAASGSLSFTVPPVDSVLARIRVSDATSPAVADLSDGNFSIATSPPAPSPAPTPTPAPAPPPASLAAIALGDAWHYDDRDIDPGAAWTSVAFDDSAWRVGAGQLGYGDGDEVTVLSKKPVSQPSVYFRKRLTLAQGFSHASLKVVHDDGVAVFLNGTLLFSKYVAGGLAHATYASATSAENEVSLAEIPLPANLAVAGENVVAVVVKQAGGTSSDVSFDLALTLSRDAAPPPAVAHTLQVQSPNGGETLGTGASFTVRWATTGAIPLVDLDLSGDGGLTFAPLARGLANAGTFSFTPAAAAARALLKVSEPDGTSDVSDAPFTVSATQQVVPFGSVWRYDDRGIDQGSAWVAPGFDDATWKAGPAQLGYGDGDEKTVLVKTSPVRPTAYFRTRFTLASPPTQASLRVLHDDGVAVFVNGVQVFSKYLSGGLAYAAWADTTTENENSAAPIALSPNPFVAGVNVIAVEVKQSNPVSSDLSFDLELSVTP